MSPLLSRADRIKARIERWESLGSIDPTCTFCQQHFYPALREGREPHAPRHKASDRCESGQRSHCTCSACF